MALLFAMILTIPVPYSDESCPIFHCQVCEGEKKTEEKKKVCVKRGKKREEKGTKKIREEKRGKKTPGK